VPQNQRILTTFLDLLEYSPEKGLLTGTTSLVWWLGMTVAAIYLVSRLELFWPAKVLWAYALVRALWIIEFPITHYGINTRAFQAYAGANAIEVALVPALILFLSDRARMWVWYSLRFAAIYLCLCAWMKWGGPQLTPSFNLALVALYLPFAPLWVWVVAVPTILSHHAGTAQLMLAVQLGVFTWKRWGLLRTAMGLVPGAAALLGVMYYHSHGPALDMLGRLDRWSWTGRFMRSWLYADHTGATHHLSWPNILLGVGPGSFTPISIMIDNYTHPLVVYLHNEFQQVPWELGVFALLLMLAVYARAVWKARFDVQLLASLAAMVPLCAMWHPFRFFLPAMMVGLVIHRALFHHRSWKWDPELQDMKKMFPETFALLEREE
jgi:hypothetical protein